MNRWAQFHVDVQAQASAHTRVLVRHLFHESPVSHEWCVMKHVRVAIVKGMRVEIGKSMRVRSLPRTREGGGGGGFLLTFSNK